jgi:hypothetical protein
VYCLYRHYTRIVTSVDEQHERISWSGTWKK